MPKKQTDTKLVAVRMPDPLLKRIQRWSKKAGRMSDSDAIRALLDAALESKERTTAPELPAWVTRLEEIAARSKSKIEDLVDLLAKDLDEQLASDGDEIVDPRPVAKPVKKGTTLRSWFA